MRERVGEPEWAQRTLAPRPLPWLQAPTEGEGEGEGEGRCFLGLWAPP